MSRYFSVKEAASYLEVEVAMVRSMLAHGWLPGEKLERSWRIPVDAVESFLSCVRPSPRWESDPQGELVLAHNHRCPACGGHFRNNSASSSCFAEEFLECQDCGLSLHDSLLGDREALSEHVALHGEELHHREDDGMRARALLQRRSSALTKVHELLDSQG